MSTLSKIYLVRDVMMPLHRFPVIRESVILKEALEEMGRTRIGIACIVDNNRKLKGVITDGDFRRKLLKVQKPFSSFLIDDALDHAIRSPKTVSPSASLQNAVAIMADNQIWDLPVVDDSSVLVGLLHLHPAVEALLELR